MTKLYQDEDAFKTLLEQEINEFLNNGTEWVFNIGIWVSTFRANVDITPVPVGNKYGSNIYDIKQFG